MKRIILLSGVSLALSVFAALKQSEEIRLLSPAENAKVSLSQTVCLEWQCAHKDGRACAGPYAVEVMKHRTGQRFYSAENLTTNAVEVGKLEAGEEYTWCVWCGKEVRGGRFFAEGSAACGRGVKPTNSEGLPRWQKADGLGNLRDLGGWRGVGGRRVKTGRVFRSEQLDKIPGKGRDVLVGELGIRTDLDLRTPESVAKLRGVSPLGKGVRYSNQSSAAYVGFDSKKGRKNFAETFRWFLNEAEYPVVFHCAKGADRTGSWAFLLNGLLGVCERDLRFDWEVTANFNPNPLFKHRKRYDELVKLVNRREGKTFTDRVVAYARDCGITDAEIAKWREMMLEGKGDSAVADEEPQLRVGILSDTHLKLAEETHHALEDAFREFGRRGVDVVVISGDLVEDGRRAEYGLFLEVWLKAFGAKPGRDKAPSLFVAWGNHDYRAASKFRNRTFTVAEEDEFMLAHKDEVWREFFGEPFPGEIYARTYKGVSFVGAHWGHENEIGPWLKAHASEVDTSKFFICVHHLHPSGTVFAGAKTEAVPLVRDLAAYPNCFSISGHCHTSLADDTALWQGAFTAMGAGALGGTAPRHGAGGRKYANGCFSPKGAKPPYPHMKTCRMGKSRQGSVMFVYRDRVVVSRIDFISRQPLGDDWVLPLPLETHPETPHVLPARSRGPAFDKGVRVACAFRDGKNAMDEPERQLVVKVPQARPTAKYGRAIWNRFELVDAKTGETFRKANALQPGQALPIEAGLAFPAECVFAQADIPAGREFKVRVTPMNAADLSGAPVESETMRCIP